MKNLQFILLFPLSLLLLIACGEDPKDNPVLKEAFAIHNEAIKASEPVKAQIAQVTKMKDDLKQLMNRMQIEAKPMDEELFNKWKSAHSALNKVEKDFGAWTENLVEVPGFEHEHDHSAHDHDHDHDHGAEVKLTPDQMLSVQKEALTNIQQLGEQVGNALTLASNAMKEEPAEAM